MSTKQTEWKSVDLAQVSLDFTGAKQAHLECTSHNFVSLTMTLKDNQVVRIRKNDYSVTIEAPVIPTVTKFLVKTPKGLNTLFDSSEKAHEAADGIVDAEVVEVVEPKPVEAVAEIPF